MLNNDYVKMQELLGDLCTNELIAFLNEHHYWTCPASVKHHGNETGGLFAHSIAVAKTLIDLTNKLGLVWQREESPAIIGLFHDMCKTDDYVYVVDSPGKELFGGAVVNEAGHWDYNPEPIVKGHGDKSVLMLSTVLQLTEEEMYCIRFHMGAFTDSSEWKFYTNAVHKFNNVLWVHQADMIAAHCLGV